MVNVASRPQTSIRTSRGALFNHLIASQPEKDYIEGEEYLNDEYPGC